MVGALCNYHEPRWCCQDPSSVATSTDESSTRTSYVQSCGHRAKSYFGSWAKTPTILLFTLQQKVKTFLEARYFYAAPSMFQLTFHTNIGLVYDPKRKTLWYLRRKFSLQELQSCAYHFLTICRSHQKNVEILPSTS